MKINQKPNSQNHLMNIPSNEYFKGLTSLRGIAAIWVLFFHLDVIIFYRDLGPLIPHEWSGILTNGYLWVDFFFILSGFIISHVYGNELSDNFGNINIIKKYIWARFTRIYPLHVFTILLLIVFVLIVPSFYPKAIDGSWETYFAWSALWDNLLLIHSMKQHTYLSWNIVSWSIGAEWWSYLAACLLIPLIFKSKNYITIVLSVLSFFTLYVLQTHFQKLDITFDYGWLRCLSEFTLGVITYKIFITSKTKNWLSSDIAFGLCFIMIILLFQFNLNDLFVIPLFIILLLSTIYNDGFVKQILASKPLHYLGEISYSIYMIHGIWFMVYWFAFPYLKTEYNLETLSFTMKLIYVISFFGLTLVSAHFTYYGVEVKCRKWLKGLVKG